MHIGILLSALSLLGTTDHPPSHLLLKSCEFAEAYQFSKTECTVELQNTGERPIQVMSADAVVAGDRLEPSTFVVPPRSSVYSRAQIALRNEVGRTKRLFKLLTDEQGQEKRNIEVDGYVTTVLDEPRPKLDFGVVNLPGAVAEKSLLLTSQEVANFRATEIISSPPYLNVKLDPKGTTLSAAIRPNADWGLYESDFVKLKINSPKQAELWVSVRADIHGSVVPDINPYSLGLLRKGQDNEFTIRLTSRDERDFKIGKVEVSKLKANVSVTQCSNSSGGCKLLKLRVLSEQPTGAIGGVVKVELPEYKQSLPIYVWGMLVGEKTVVKDFNEDMKRSEEAGAKSGKPLESSSVKGAASTPLNEVIKKNIAGNMEQSSPPPDGSGPLLKWSVQNEESVHGYIIYRSDKQDGPFLRMNESTILARGSNDRSESYQWRDKSTIRGNTYWYYVGVLNKDGTKSRLSADQKITAK